MKPDGPAAEAPPQILEAPPEPPPDPPRYIPPWEQLRPGQRMPGGSGW